VSQRCQVGVICGCVFWSAVGGLGEASQAEPLVHQRQGCGPRDGTRKGLEQCKPPAVRSRSGRGTGVGHARVGSA
jgi:hypothetical protein